MVIFSHSYGLCAWRAYPRGGKGKRCNVIKTAGTRYRLMPTDRKEIIRCAVIACLAVCAFFAIVHGTALLISVMP